MVFNKSSELEGMDLIGKTRRTLFGKSEISLVACSFRALLSGLGVLARVRAERGEGPFYTRSWGSIESPVQRGDWPH